MPTEQLIVDEIRGALADDGRIKNPRQVAVSERAGTVTLRGTVGSPHQRRTAVEVVRSIPGVVDVEDQLHVDPRDHWEENQLRGEALQALISDDAVPDDRVEVHVGTGSGWVTLKGKVKHQAESDAAFAAVSRIPGIGGITNEIKVVTAGADG